MKTKQQRINQREKQRALRALSVISECFYILEGILGEKSKDYAEKVQKIIEYCKKHDATKELAGHMLKELIELIHQQNKQLNDSEL